MMINLPISQTRIDTLEEQLEHARQTFDQFIEEPVFQRVVYALGVYDAFGISINFVITKSLDFVTSNTELGNWSVNCSGANLLKDYLAEYAISHGYLAGHRSYRDMKMSKGFTKKDIIDAITKPLDTKVSDIEDYTIDLVYQGKCGEILDLLNSVRAKHQRPVI